MKYKLFLFAALLIFNLSILSSDASSNNNTCNKQITEISSTAYENTYVRVLINGEWWMYVYGGPGGTVLIDRYKIEE